MGVSINKQTENKTQWKSPVKKELIIPFHRRPYADSQPVVECLDLRGRCVLALWSITLGVWAQMQFWLGIERQAK